MSDMRSGLEFLLVSTMMAATATALGIEAPKSERSVENAQKFIERVNQSIDTIEIDNSFLSRNIDITKHPQRCFVELKWTSIRNQSAWAKFDYGKVVDIYGDKNSVFLNITGIQGILFLRYKGDLNLRAAEAFRYLKKQCDTSPDLAF